MKLAKIFLVSVVACSLVSGCAPTTPVTSTPAAFPAADTPTAQPTTYDMGGMQVILQADFPQTPAEMTVYTARDERLATVEDVKTLARLFKMNGPIYALDAQSGIPGGMLGGEKEYLMADGNRLLRVRSDKYFTYIPNNVLLTEGLFTLPPANAETLVEEFMQAYDFDFEYQIVQEEKFNYYVLALSPEGLGVWYGNQQFDGLRFHFDRDRIAQVDASLLQYDPTAGMQIISAEQALQKLLDPGDTYGYIQGGGGGGSIMIGDTLLKPEDMRKWIHVRPLDETLTYNGYLSSAGKSVDGGAPLVLLDGYPVTGKVSDIPENMPGTYIEARGQFHTVNGVKSFEMDSWKKVDGYEETIMGTLQREGDQVVLDDGSGRKYILQDVPQEIDLPMQHAFAHGTPRGDIFDWNIIDNTGGGGGGGGGGGYSGFYKINFSGTPVTFPTRMPEAPTPVAEIKTVEAMRGTLQVNLFPQADGTERAAYQFLPYDSQYSGTSFQLTGNLDASLKNYHYRPIDVWGSLDEGNFQITVDHYQAPFPDLKFELVHGSQRLETVEGQSVTIVTTDDGTKYIVLMAEGTPNPMQLIDPGFVPDPNSPSGEPGPDADDVIYEALRIPGETVLGYPGMRVFNSAPGTVDGKPNSLAIINDQPNVFPGPPQVEITSMTIEKIELAYFAPDVMYTNNSPFYVQPVWRFYGHYNSGSSFEILIQALAPEFLLPEVDAATAP
jgi:hypothetical protein